MGGGLGKGMSASIHVGNFGRCEGTLQSARMEKDFSRREDEGDVSLRMTKRKVTLSLSLRGMFGMYR
jgi:hypothetical protein